ncbi:uncharacterized protein LOC108095792 [Drosophila ficusphila]|uniref:uncharacterized protein LOC108095792 n=1 Tax=Drosophila ficusphila TaxID=30025 RepID=UPI0007E82115|nr:uncharacterized protein LOC108095792 [Drosophila ficusphila]XP_017052540.1 uncharacterized protein LOC108095792 [Drosophila ficusphila]
MGSIEKACISGFLCRLCSEMHRTVIHIYSDHGQRLCLVEKINGYLPITISPTDPLPKTICKTCLHRVEQHYSLLMRLTRMRDSRKIRFFECKSRRETRNPSISSVEYSDEEDQGARNESGSTETETQTGPQDQGSPKSTETVVPEPNSSENLDDSGAGPSNREPKQTASTTGNTTQELT